MVGSNVYAVLEFFTDQSECPDDSFLETLKTIGAELGKVYARVQVRQELIAAKQEAEAASKAKAAARRRLKRPGHVKAGRPTIVSSRLRLHELSFEQLRQVVESVRDEAQRRLSEFEEVFA